MDLSGPRLVSPAVMDFSIAPDDRLLQQSVRDFIEHEANAV